MHILVVVHEGNALPEFVVSIAKLSSKHPEIQVVAGTERPGDIDTTKYKCVIFMSPRISFPVSAIEAIIEDCAKHNCISGVAVPHRRIRFEKTTNIVKSRVWNGDMGALERLSSEFTVTTSNPVTLDSSAIALVTKFCRHDIVGVDGSVQANDFENGFLGCSAIKRLHTRFITSNCGTMGCLLEQIRFISSFDKARKK